MKSLISIVIITFLTLTINAQSVSFNHLKDAALGEEDVLKRELIENGWTMEKMDDAKSYGYVYNIFGITFASVIFSDSYISCRSIELFDDLYEEIKSKCTYNGIETFESVPVDYISYKYEEEVEFRVYSQDDVYYIDAEGSSSSK